MGEIVSFAAYKAERDAQRADAFCTIGVIDEEARVGDIVLCRCKDGGLALDCVKGKAPDGTWLVHSGRYEVLAAVIGRVVSTYEYAENEGA